jgi:hypothetical protein
MGWEAGRTRPGDLLRPITKRLIVHKRYAIYTRVLLDQDVRDTPVVGVRIDDTLRKAGRGDGENAVAAASVDQCVGVAG